MNFATGGGGESNTCNTPRWPAARGLGRVLVGCCAVTIGAAALPWTEVQFASLWGEIVGPAVLRTDAGVTCVLTSVLTALLVLAEGRAATTREAVRAACLMLMATAAAAVAWRLLRGPGSLRGATAVHSPWFFAAAVAVASAVVASRLRLPRRRLRS